MNRSELIDAVAERTGSTKSATKATLGAIEEVICDAIKSGDDVVWAGIAKFQIKVTPAAERQLPGTGEKRMFPAKTGVKVRPQKKLVDAAAASG